MARPHASTIALSCVLLLSACGGDKRKPAEGAKAEPSKQVDAPPPAPSETLKVAGDEDPGSGPLPPEGPMAFFVVEGGLIPIGCHDPKSKKIESGEACMALVAAGEKVRIHAEGIGVHRLVGARAEPLCMPGSGKKTALSVDGLEAGANFQWAVWPTWGTRQVAAVAKDTIDPRGKSLQPAERDALLALVKAKAPTVAEIVAHQVATVELKPGTPDKIYSVVAADPAGEGNLFSGLVLAKAGDSTKLHLLESSKKLETYEVHGAVDLDGDGTRELWVSLAFEDGGGDRMYRIEGDKAVAIGGWTCGA